MALKAISFDLWDTVIHDDSDEPKRKAMGLRSKYDERRHLVQDALKRAGDDIGLGVVVEAYDRADAAFNKAWKGDHVTWPIRQRLEVVLTDLGKDLPPELMDQIVRAHENMELVIKPDPVHGVVEAIQNLSGRYRLCVVSDAIVSPGSVLREILRGYGADRYFASYAFSDEIGHSKPHRDMFQHVATELDVAFDEMVHIGDRDHNDIKGPQELGMKAILFTGTRDADKATTSADAICEKHVNLPAIVDRLAAGCCSVAGELYARLLKKHMPGAAVDILYPSDPGAGLPNGIGFEDYDGVAWTGCNLTAYEKEPRVVSQIELAHKIFEIGTPSFGSCWAAQIAVAAAGGIVRASPYGREMGIGRKISLTPEGRGHPMYAGKPSVFDAFISHVDEVTHLPPGSLVLAGNNFSAVQAVCVTYKRGTFWAPQYHIEYDLHEMARLIACRKEKLMSLGFFRDGDQCDTYVAQLEALHQDPSRFDLAWALGIDDDIMREEVRQREIANWMEQQVLPRVRR